MAFERLSSRHKTDGPEQSRNRFIKEPTKFFSRVTAAALAANAIFVEPQISRAAEVTPQMSWQEGAAAFKKDVYQADHEVRGAYVRTRDGNGYWITIGDGPKVHTNANAGVLGEVDVSEQDLATEQSALLKEDIAAGKIESVCAGHSHPLRAGAPTFFTPQEAEIAQKTSSTTISMPPSGVDAGFSGYEHFFGTARHESMVFDPTGVWYYHTATVADLRERPELLERYTKALRASNKFIAYYRAHVSAKIENLSLQQMQSIMPITRIAAASNMELLSKARKELAGEITDGVLTEEGVGMLMPDQEGRGLYQNWVDLVVKGIDENIEKFNQAYQGFIAESRSGTPAPSTSQRLQDAYLRINSKVRFVPYDKLGSEPPCAGASYKTSR